MHRIQDELQRQVWELEKVVHDLSGKLSNAESRIETLEYIDN
jgi:hypothetical protein